MLAAMRRPYQLVFASVLLGALGTLAASTRSSDPLAAEIGRWSAYLSTNTSKDEDWEQIKFIVSAGALSGAEKALADGRRLLALQNLVEGSVPAGGHRVRGRSTRPCGARTRPPSRPNGSGCQAVPELARSSAALALGFDGVARGGARAGRGRAAAGARLLRREPRLRAQHDAGRGLYYLGAARAQREFVASAGRSRAPGRSRPPCARSRPSWTPSKASCWPPTVRRPRSKAPRVHRRQLAAQGGARARRGRPALWRAAALPAGRAALRSAARGARLRARPHGARRSRARAWPRGGVDHSLGRLFLETAQAEVAADAAGGRRRGAADRSRRAPALLRGARAREARAARPAPGVTVTLVRWPYT